MASYTATLIADGYGDVEIPISNLSIRLRQSPLQCYVNVTIPAVLEWITEIGQRADGEIRIDEDGSEIITANIYEFRYDIGATSRSGSITAYKQITFPGNDFTYDGTPIYKRITPSGTTYRTLPDINIKPGYYCYIGAEKLLVESVTWTVDATYRVMEFTTIGIPLVTLVVSETTHTHSADLVELPTFIYADALTHSQLADGITLMPGLMVAGMAHTHLTDAVVVDANINLSPADMAHGQTADALGDLSATDGAFADVVVLTHFDGTDGGTTTTNEASGSVTLTFDGSAELDDTQKVFGATSLYCEGTTSYVLVSDDAAFDIGSTDDFTWEMWVRPTSFATQGSRARGMFSYGGSGSYLASSPVLQFNTSGYVTLGAAGNILTSANPCSLNTWYHIAIVRESGTIYLYVNGQEEDSTANSGTYSVQSAGAYIGRSLSSGGHFAGWIDEVRITIGTARYHAEFSTPELPFPNA